MFTIKSRIIMAYTVVFGLVLVVFAGIIYHDTRMASIDKLDARLANFALRVEEELEEAVWEMDGHQPEDHAPETTPANGVDRNKLNRESLTKKLASIPLDELSGVRFQLFDKSGTVIHSDSLLAQIPSKKILQASLRIPSLEVIRLNGQNYRCLWRLINAEHLSFILQSTSSMEEMDSDLHRLLFTFIFLIPLSLGLMGITAFFISRAAFRPITHMAQTAGNITAGNLDNRLQLPKAHDEVRMLGETLNDMIGRIDEAFKSQKRFISDAAHEIRTPLTIIQTELEFAQRHSKNEQVSESIQIALSEMERISNLTSALLTLSKLDATQIALDKQPTRMDELLLECVQIMKRAIAERKVDVKLSIDEAIEIMVDSEKLKSVFVNLLDNAIKYSGHGSTISIALKRPDLQTVIVSIADNGPGIPASELPLIFNRFYRSNETRSQIGGNGLGLAIAQEFVNLHDGRIEVESAVGKGTVFYVNLPKL